MIRAAEYALHAKQTFGSELASKASEVCVCVWRAGVSVGWVGERRVVCRCRCVGRSFPRVRVHVRVEA